MTEQPLTPERISLDLAEVGTARRRGGMAVGIAVLFGAATGYIIDLLAGETAGLVAAAVVVLVLLVLAWMSGRRKLWLEGSRVVAHTIGRKVVNLSSAERTGLVVTDIRGTRTIGLVVGGGGKTINISLASYAGTGGRELGILVLRRLADALASNADSSFLVVSQLLIAQLRAKAKGDPPAERPLYRLASLAPSGRLAQRLRTDAVTRFVASLD